MCVRGDGGGCGGDVFGSSTNVENTLHKSYSSKSAKRVFFFFLYGNSKIRKKKKFGACSGRVHMPNVFRWILSQNSCQ